MMQVKIENQQTLSRDMYSKAIINNSRSSYISAKESKDKRLSLDKKVEDMENDINSIRSDISQILELLKSK